MKKLDLLSWIEKNIYTVAIFVSIVPAVFITRFLDELYLAELVWYIKHPLNMALFAVIILVVLLVLLFINSVILEPSFTIIRRIAGRKPLKEVEEEIEDENYREEDERDALTKRSFSNLSASEQNYTLAMRQKNIFNELKKEVHDLKILVYVLLVLIIGISYHLFF